MPASKAGLGSGSCSDFSVRLRLAQQSLSCKGQHLEKGKIWQHIVLCEKAMNGIAAQPYVPHPNNNYLRATSTAGKDNQNKDNQRDNGEDSNPSWRNLAAVRAIALATDVDSKAQIIITELSIFVLAKTFTLLTKNTKKNSKRIRTEDRG